MPTHPLEELAARINACPHHGCPMLRKGADDWGLYPKVFVEPRDTAGVPNVEAIRVVLLFMNPAKPTSSKLAGDWNEELDYRFGEVTAEQNRSLCKANGYDWLFKKRKEKQKKLNPSIWERNGFDFDTNVYWTNAVKCPGKIDKNAASLCSDSYLKKELQQISAKAIICFGWDAYDELMNTRLVPASASVVRSAGLVERFREDPLITPGPPRVFLAPHPSYPMNRPQLSMQDYEAGLERILLAIP